MRRLILAKVGNDPNNMELTRTATFGGNERLDFRADIEKCFWYRRFLKKLLYQILFYKFCFIRSIPESQIFERTLFSLKSYGAWFHEMETVSSK